MPDLIARLRAAGCVFAEDEAALLQAEASSARQLEEWARRRIAGEPLEYVVGWAEFDDQRVGLDAGVFIPRQRSVLLVDVAHEALLRTTGPAVVVDLCCGSGALGLALAHRSPDVVLHAADDDAAAVACAARNLAPIGGTAHLGDLDAPLPDTMRGQVEVIIANVPYVPSEQVALMPADSREHEPRSTVDGGADGLDLLRRVAARAPLWLCGGGTLVCEIAPEQTAAAAAAFERAGLDPRIHTDDEREATAISGTS